MRYTMPIDPILVGRDDQNESLEYLGKKKMTKR